MSFKEAIQRGKERAKVLAFETAISDYLDVIKNLPNADSLELNKVKVRVQTIILFVRLRNIQYIIPKALKIGSWVVFPNGDIVSETDERVKSIEPEGLYNLRVVRD